jgi:hypothetical protein
MKTVVLAAFVLLLSSTAEAGFQDTEWGMSPKEVIKAQKIAKDQREWDSKRKILLEAKNVAGAKSAIVYIFVDSKLVRTKVIFMQDHTNELDYLTDFRSMGEKLRKVYGEPTETNEIWLRDLYRNRPSRWGMALQVGDLSKYVTWKLDDTTILHAIHGENYEVEHVIEYRSRELAALEKAHREKQDAADL